MLIINPSIVVSNLLYYYDLNNSKCYSWDGSLICKNIITYSDILSAYSNSIFNISNAKRFFDNSIANKLGGTFLPKTLERFTIQFWVKLEKDFSYDSDANRILGTQSLSSISTLYELTYNNENITYNNDILVFNYFTEMPLQEEALETFTIFLNLTGGLGFYNSNFNPTSAISEFSIPDDRWVFITIVKTDDSIKLYRNLDEEIYIYRDSSFVNAVTYIYGLQTFLNSYKLNHICIYNEALTFKDIVHNYKSFVSKYKNDEEPSYYNEQIPSSSKSFNLN